MDVRENAAEKLGEIALQSPIYCKSILRQVCAASYSVSLSLSMLVLIRLSDNTDTQAARRHAMGRPRRRRQVPGRPRAVVSERPIGPWDCRCPLRARFLYVRCSMLMATGQKSIMTGCAPIVAGREALCPRLNFRTVDLDTVLRDGAPLLRSGGEEYAYETDLSDEQRKRQAVRQRQLLLRRICGSGGSTTDGMWKTGEDALAQQLLPRLNSERTWRRTDRIWMVRE
jgi:hypothetical protein